MIFGTVVHPVGGAMLWRLPDWCAITASKTSPATVAAGRPRLSDVAVPAVPDETERIA